MTTDALGYIALGIMAAITFLALVLAVCVVGLWLKFHDESDEQRVGLRATIFGDPERGR